MKPFKRAKMSVSLATVIACMPHPSLAIASDDYAIEEVVVTATKRAESLQDVAVAVTALSGDTLANSRISRSEDLVNLTPSLSFQSGGSDNGSSFNIRGIGTQSFSSGVEPSIATVIDGVVMGRSGMAFTELLDVERVEVLRGPQGMLFGKNASGGVVHIITNDPGNEFEASINAKTILSGTDEYKLSGMVSVPVTDTLGIRIAAFTTEPDSHINNINSGKELNGRKSEGGRIKLKWQPTNELTAKWSSDYSEINGTCCQFQSRSATAIESTFLGDVTASHNNDAVNISADIYNNSRSWGHSLDLGWDIGEYTFTSISAYRNWQSSANTDVDGTPLTLLDVNAGQSQQRQLTQEFRLSSPQNEAFSYVLGLYYFEQNMTREFERVYHDLFASALPATIPVEARKLGSQFEASVDSTSYAGFGQFTLNLSDDFRLIGGARYTQEELEFEFEREQAQGVFSSLAPVQAPYSDATNDTDWSFKLGAQWDINADSMGYLTWTEGYKGPAFNVIFEMTPDNTKPVEAEVSDSLELGVKSSWLDNRLIVNAALFHSRYDNFQAQAQDANSAQFTLLNAGEVRTTGLELDFIARPLQALTVSGGFAYIDAEISDFKAGPCSPRQSAINENSCALGSQDLSGETLPNSSKVKFNLSADYVIALSDRHEIVPRATYRWKDDELFSMDQDKEKSQDGYGILDLSLSLHATDDSYSVTLFVDNALDEQYVDAIIHNNIWPGAYDHYYSIKSERRIGLDLRYSWF